MNDERGVFPQRLPGLRCEPRAHPARADLTPPCSGRHDEAAGIVYLQDVRVLDVECVFDQTNHFIGEYVQRRPRQRVKTKPGHSTLLSGACRELPLLLLMVTQQRGVPQCDGELTGGHREQERVELSGESRPQAADDDIALLALQADGT